MIKVAINTFGLHSFFDNDYDSVINLVRQADDAGIDALSMGEHVIMGEDWSAYPFGRFASPIDFPWMDPIVMLAAFAEATSRIRLSTGVLLTPLRSAILLAKQLASLDVISRGRLEIGVGTGWQKAEYDASNIAFDTRLDHLYEQIRVCHTLWREAPASYSGQFYRFDRLYSLPAPVQKGGIPILFGVPPSRRNFDEIAKIGHGWLPLGLSLEKTARGVGQLREAFSDCQRDPLSLEVRHVVIPEFESDGLADIRKVVRGVDPWIDAGVTTLEFFPTMFCRDKQDFGDFLDIVISLKR